MGGEDDHRGGASETEMIAQCMRRRVENLKIPNMGLGETNLICLVQKSVTEKARKGVLLGSNAAPAIHDPERAEI